MGECAYYIKAAFKNNTEAKKALPKFNAFLTESNGACKFYHKGKEGTNKDFWKSFETNFPIITTYVKKYVLDDKGNSVWEKDIQGLSGMLDFGQDDLEAVQYDNIIGHTDAMVWHFADWGPFADWVKGELGAVRVVVDNEENGCGSLDSLNLYEWETIVQDILKQKKLLPLLLGINQELDALIATRMKK